MIQKKLFAPKFDRMKAGVYKIQLSMLFMSSVSTLVYLLVEILQ